MLSDRHCRTTLVQAYKFTDRYSMVLQICHVKYNNNFKQSFKAVVLSITLTRITLYLSTVISNLKMEALNGKTLIANITSPRTSEFDPEAYNT